MAICREGRGFRYSLNGEYRYQKQSKGAPWHWGSPYLQGGAYIYMITCIFMIIPMIICVMYIYLHDYYRVHRVPYT